MRSAISCALLALTITEAAAAEDPNSANAILPACRAFLGSGPPANYLAGGYCSGVVAGIAFMAQTSNVGLSAFSGDGKSRALKDRWTSLCVPNGVIREQVVRVVVRYIDVRPGRMHEDFMSLALEALFDAWPCRK
jgi:Rap1a immunity proteins